MRAFCSGKCNDFMISEQLKPSSSRAFHSFFFLLFLFLSSSPLFAEQALTFDDCVREATKANPEIRAATLQIQSSKFKTRAMQSGFFPQVSTGLRYDYGNGSGNTSSSNSSYSANVTATQDLFSGFSDVAKVKQAQANEEISDANLQIVKAKVSYDLKSAFARLRYAQSALKLSQEIIHRRQDNLNLLKLRYENGKENQGALLLSEAYLEQARYDGLLARDVLELARQELSRALGREEASSLKIAGEIPLRPPPSQPDWKTLVQSVPEYRQTLSEEKSATAAITSARSPFYPNLDVSTTLSRQDNTQTNANNRFTVSAGLSWPLFNGGKDYYATQEAVSNLKIAKENEVATRRKFLVQLRQAYWSFAEAHQKLKVDRSFLKALQVRGEIARTQYENGLLSFQDWDSIENDLINRQKQVLQSERERIISEAAWEQVQGGSVF